MGARGSGGHNRKPTRLKELQGNPGHHKLNRREPKPKPGIPKMPAGLSTVAIREWKDIVPLLVGMGVLTQADGKALAAYCSCFAQWMLAEAEIARDGITFVAFHGAEDGEIVALDRKVHPAVRVRSDALRQMKSFLIEFGLTPASRCKLEVKEDGGAQDPLEDFLRGKAASDVVQ